MSNCILCVRGWRTNSLASKKIPTASLVLQLCIYRLRMYSVWPVVKVEQLIASLQSDSEDYEMYAFANAVGAATIAQLKLADTSEGRDAVSGERMEEECQRARSESDKARQANLTTLRTAFFLHIYHENQDPGGVKSLLFLRESITMAQMLRLDRESSYKKLSMDEQQVRRRILWLLFITERGVSMLHKLPVVLKPNIAFPTDFADDETTIFPAFQKLVNLFWIFDQSHAFDILQENDVDVLRIGGAEATNTKCLDLLQSQLQEISITSDSTNDIQTADIAVTRQWMRAVLWKASKNNDLVGPTSSSVEFCSHPFQIAKDFLEVTSRLPGSAFEAHGLCAELKIFEIATSVTDAIAYAARSISWVSMNRPRELLNRLHQILSSTRGGNQNLVMMLRGKIAQITSAAPMSTLVEPSAQVIEEVDEIWEEEQTTAINELAEIECSTFVSYDLDNGMAMQMQPQSFLDPAIPLSMFDQIDSSSTIAVETVPSMTTTTLQTQQHNFMPYQWHIAQQGFVMEVGDDLYANHSNGFYGRFHSTDADLFGDMDATKFTSSNDLRDDEVANGIMDMLPVQDRLSGWQ